MYKESSIIMKVTKLVHSCLLVEMPAPINRTVLFDPGILSTVNADNLEYLDDIVITHSHSDHFSPEIVKQLVAKFPTVRITAADDVVAALNAESIAATSAAGEGMIFFESPHEDIEPMFPTPPNLGVHYLDRLTHPGDSLHFSETMPVLALPVDAPWGAPNDALRLALKLKPKYVIPIHDWFWHEQARTAQYNRFAEVLGEQGIEFIKPVNGEPFVLEA
jgi:L-ascorbate metabolism protein UlaG (beta-lactamase superfamily)